VNSIRKLSSERGILLISEDARENLKDAKKRSQIEEMSGEAAQKQ
jgi:hypothetical protein